MVVIYEFKLNEREKMQEKMKKLSKTGEVKEIFIIQPNLQKKD